MSGPAAVPSVRVEIFDQPYHLRGADIEYVQRIAAVVDAKMRAVAAAGGTADSLRIAVLAALNLADEMESLRRSHEALQHERQRIQELSGVLDRALAG
jgi:cell division protein ZapA